MKFLWWFITLSIVSMPIHSMVRTSQLSPVVSCAYLRTFHTSSSLMYEGQKSKLNSLMWQRERVGKQQRELNIQKVKSGIFVGGGTALAGGGLALVYLGGHDVIHSLCSSTIIDKEFLFGCVKMLFGTGTIKNCWHVIDSLGENYKEIEWEQKRLDMAEKRIIDEIKKFQKKN